MLTHACAGRIALFDTRSGRTTHVTSDRWDSYSPAWSPDGSWLYFLSDRNLVSSVGSPWGMRAPDPYFDNQAKLYAVSLQADAKWPFAPKTELDAETKPDSSKAGPGAKGIQLDGIATRLHEVPVPAGNYNALSTDGTRLYFMSLVARSPARRNLVALELKAEAKAEAFLEDVTGYELTLDRKKVMVRKGSDVFVVAAGAKAPTDLASSKVDLSGWSFAVDPRAEFRQMWERRLPSGAQDAWRLERDYFYDPAMHGVDWPALREKYAPLVERVTDRAELSDVLAQLVGELSALHIFVYGGDLRRGDDNVLPASLGAVMEPSPDGWVVRHIYRSDPDIPEELSPLARPGIDIQEGDVITAINGVSVGSVAHPSELLRNQAGKQVLLSVVSSRLSLSLRPYQLIVTPITQGRETDLRYDEWEYTRRLMVDSLSGGKVGYVHIRNMGSAGIAEFMRDYYPVFKRQGLIIDVRNNTGGNIDSWLLAG